MRMSVHDAVRRVEEEKVVIVCGRDILKEDIERVFRCWNYNNERWDILRVCSKSESMRGDVPF